MTTIPDYAQLIRKLTSDDDAQQQTARLQLLMHDEDAVEPLVDAFYAGVNEQGGLRILNILGEIGGFEALALFEDVVQFSARYECWRALATAQLRRAGR